jgi:hypothetical protein
MPTLTISFKRRKAEERLVQLVREAEESGPATPWTARKRAKIQREGMRRLAAEKRANMGVCDGNHSRSRT